jgi:hypothetical protein
MPYSMTRKNRINPIFVVRQIHAAQFKFTNCICRTVLIDLKPLTRRETLSARAIEAAVDVGAGAVAADARLLGALVLVDALLAAAVEAVAARALAPGVIVIFFNVRPKDLINFRI